tara:strand:+ start:211 stop:378 length:168 start_codon:yes stop_codon:yes gene_type:complete
MLYAVTFIPRKYALAEDPSDHKEWEHVEADSEKEAIRIGEETLGMVVRVRNEVKF